MAFVCENHALAALTSASRAGQTISEAIKIIELPCTGRLETVQLLDTIRSGADGVVVIGCLEENCYHEGGSRLARGRVERCKEILEEISIEPERVEMINSASVSGSTLLLKLLEFEKRLSNLPESPFKGAMR